MSGLLSTDDVARLLATPSADLRADLAGRIGQQMTAETLAPGELAIAQDIVRLLARDVEATVRMALAHNIRAARTLPHDVAVRLAHDVESVALPVLADSLVLTDDDLIALVRAGSSDKQKAVATRSGVSERVSDALVDHGDEQAVAALMANPTATVSDDGMERAVDRFAGSDLVKETMVMRGTLPMTVAERLAVLVSRRLQDHLVQHHALSPSLATDLVMRGREDAIIRLSAGTDEPNLLGMVQQMHHSHRLTPSVVLRALCTGDIAFFEAAMAVMADVPVENARILVHDPGRGGLVSLCRKAGLPTEAIPMISAAVEAVDDSPFDGQPRDLERFRTRVISRVLTRVDTLDTADMDYLIDKLGDLMIAA